MSRSHVDHAHIAAFAKGKVNLPSDKAMQYREQAARLREKLDGYLKEHPNFSLRKMLLSGSIAKGTALRTLNDIDVACYISGADVPEDVNELLDYLVQRLRKAFPNFSKDQVQSGTYSVTVSFQDTGLDVDVVPILYDGDPDWYGDLVSQENGELLKTNIPYHLEFAKKRKKAQETHYTQVVRLLKFWAAKLKRENSKFRFKSFMIEMILSKLVDEGKDMSDYPEAIQHFFTYVAADLSKPIVFCDYYKASDVGIFYDPIQIIDPVNSENNVAKLYADDDKQLIIDAALDAGDAVDAALKAQTKEKTIDYWQKVFGPSFSV